MIGFEDQICPSKDGMRRWMRVVVVAGMIGFGLTACDEAEEQKPIGPLSTIEVTEGYAQYHGKLVRVRGYLQSTNWTAFLHPYQAPETHWHTEGDFRHSIQINDRSPDSRFIGEFTQSTEFCTSHFAEVTGHFIYADFRPPYMFYEVLEIRVWPDDRYDGPGAVCYSWDDTFISLDPPVEDIPLRVLPNAMEWHDTEGETGP